MKYPRLISGLISMVVLLVLFAPPRAEEGAGGVFGTQSHDDYERPQTCRSCHVTIYEQWSQSAMSMAFTHHWDEIEYFDLAVKHAEKNPDLKAVGGRMQRLPRPDSLGLRRGKPSEAGERQQGGRGRLVRFLSYDNGEDGRSVVQLQLRRRSGKGEAGKPRGRQKPPPQDGVSRISCAPRSTAGSATTRRIHTASGSSRPSSSGSRRPLRGRGGPVPQVPHAGRGGPKRQHLETGIPRHRAASLPRRPRSGQGEGRDRGADAPGQPRGGTRRRPS